MKKIIICFSILAALVFVMPAYAAETTPAAQAAAPQDPDAKIKREMIKKSIANYKGGDCPCPYSQNKQGLYCRTASAYSKPWAPDPPMCYFRDIDARMIEAYRKEKAEQRAQAKQKTKPKPKSPQAVKPKT